MPFDLVKSVVSCLIGADPLAAVFYTTANVSPRVYYRHERLSSMKRSIIIAGHKTSVSIEEPFWRALRDIAATKGITISNLVALIDNDRQQGNLSSHIRLFVLDYYQTLALRPGVAESSVAPTTETIR
jgi:predicted DNA-binding ribbon-helix-helix protein